MTNTEALGPYPIVGRTDTTKLIRIALVADMTWAGRPDILLLQFSTTAMKYESNLIAFDTQAERTIWIHDNGSLSVTNGFAIGYMGSGPVGATIVVDATLSIPVRDIRTATGTSYSDTTKLEDQQTSQRFLSQFGGTQTTIGAPIDKLYLSSLRGSDFRVSAFSAVALP